ncbi:hypothetical protein [Streptomyces sp. NPDC048527]|uniref:hypothetical protein n=1 Tax=Streptomyces sp. NPDC048527 TaxID=3365568 RepID=UPI0037205CE8
MIGTIRRVGVAALAGSALLITATCSDHGNHAATGLPAVVRVGVPLDTSGAAGIAGSSATPTWNSCMDQDKVDAIVGFSLTPSFLSAAPHAQSRGVPVVALGLSAPGVTAVGDFVFRW